MSERLLRLLIIGMGVFAHIVAFLQFRYQVAVLLLGIEEQYLISILLLISLTAVFRLAFTKNQKGLWFLFGVQFLILLLIGWMLGDYFGPKLTLLLALIIQIGFYFPFPKGLITSIIGLFTAVVIQTAIAPYGNVYAYFSWNDHISLISNVILVISVVALLKFQLENQVSVNELNLRLHEATLELAQANMKLQEYAISAEQDAMLNERKRVAREVHDTLAYTLTNLVMMMEAAIDLSRQNSDKLVQHLECAREQASEGLSEVRRALQALRPVQLTDLNGLAAVCRLGKAFETATQIQVEMELGDAPLCFGTEANLVIFRLVQEGLTNALRHGRASKVSVSFARINDGISVTIKDNGIGASSAGPKAGYGLVGMQERIERLGGRLQSFSKPGEGYTLVAWIPLQKE